ncbi:hypothetical protein GOBAR_DD10393 [Gossypium barbadense]|nr:hypothetical protein GOBAR_DD10393 [Gossypium barbadense]
MVSAGTSHTSSKTEPQGIHSIPVKFPANMFRQISAKTQENIQNYEPLYSNRRSHNKVHHLQNRRAEPKSRATTAKTETNEGENEPDPDVGLGAGASAAMAEAIRAKTTRERSIRKFIEEAIVDCFIDICPYTFELKSEDGDIIDCIDIYKQPSLDHPSLKNHIIQLAPSYNPNMEEIQTSEQPLRSVTSQVWQKSGSCPKGTIPVVRRTHNDDELLSNSRKKSPLTVHQRNHSKAILLTEGYNYAGVKADIKVWNPHVESDDEYSTSRISLRSGPWYDFESVEAGWAVNPGVYGDRQTRLFAYWTVDASKKTGCFDLTCPGFVQTSHEIALGAAIYPISVFQGLPYQITLFIFKDPNTNNLWVQYGERTNIGYWPPKLFTTLTYGAECAEWGGDVYSSKLEQVPHTETQMGNGNFPDYIDGNSGYMKRMRILDISLNLKFPEWVGTYADEYWCYQSQYVSDYVVDPEFYFGGPRRNEMCP